MQRTIFHRLNYFKVENCDWYSDHAMISFSFRVKIDNNNIISKYWKKIVKSFQDWNDETKTKFKEALQPVDLQSRLDNFTNANFSNVNIATDMLTEIIQMAMQRVFPKRQHKRSYIKAFIPEIKKFPILENVNLRRGPLRRKKNSSNETKVIWTGGNCLWKSKENSTRFCITSWKTRNRNPSMRLRI